MGLRIVARVSGQATVEYLLLMSFIVSMMLIFGLMFHQKIIGGIFTLVGMVIGTANPTPGGV